MYDFIVNSGYAEGLGFFENYKDFKIDEGNLKKVIRNLSTDKSEQNKLEKNIALDKNIFSSSIYYNCTSLFAHSPR